MRSESVARERRGAAESVGEGRVCCFGRPLAGDDGATAAVVRIVAQRRGVPLARLLHRSRCEAGVAEARMLAMYLMHVVLSRSYSEVGAALGRDRTTVAHACARIEDRRDDVQFDDEVAALEAEIAPLAGRNVHHAAG